MRERNREIKREREGEGGYKRERETWGERGGRKREIEREVGEGKSDSINVQPT